MNIKFTNINQIPDFVELMEKFSPDVDVVDGRCVIDGKSLNGVLSLGLYKDFDVYIHTNDEDIMNEFAETVTKYKEKINDCINGQNGIRKESY